MRSPSSSSLGMRARVGRVVFAVLMGYAWAGGLLLAQAPQPVEPGGAPAARLAPAELADHLDRMFDLLAEVQRALPRDTFDPQAVVEQVGRDPAALFAWVRDNTYFVPYDGCLKGPAGVLMDRAGNSLDRALLLAQLLDESGYDVRLARAPLDPAGVEAWRAKVRPVPVNRFGAPRTDDRGGDVLQAASTRCRVDVAALRQQIDPHLAQSRAHAEAAQRRVAEQTAAVLSALGERGDAASPPDAAAAGPAPAEHWWVRYRAAAGAWTDLDPTLPDAAPSQRAVPTKGGGQDVPLGRAGRPPLPDGPWWHEVVVRVVVERRAANGVVQQDVALQHPLRPALLHGAVVQLSNRPLDGPARLSAGDVKQFDAAVAGAKRWTPVLVVGAQVIYQKGFDDAGRVFDNPYASKNAEISRSAGGGAASGGMFGALEGADASPTTAAAGQGTLSAVWIEYEIRSPGREPRKIRREIFDLVGPVARAAGDKAEPTLTDAQRLDRGLRLLGETQVLAQVCRPSDAFVAHAYARAMLANRRALVAVAAACGKDPAAVEGAMGRLRPMPTGVYGFAATREAWTTAAASGAAVYLDTPNVLNYRTRLARGADGRYRSVTMFDLVNNDVAVAGGAAVDPFRARVEQGVADTVVEDVLTGGGDPASDSLENTADVLAVAAGRGIATTTIRGKGDGAALAQLDWPDAARQRAADSLNNGCWLVAPRQALAAAGGGAGDARRVGWYRVDPATGTTVGVMDNGFHAGTTEDSIKRAEVLFAKIAPYSNNGNVGAQNALIELTMMASRAAAGEAVTTLTAGQAVGLVLGGIAVGLMLVGMLFVQKE